MDPGTAEAYGVQSYPSIFNSWNTNMVQYCKSLGIAVVPIRLWTDNVERWFVDDWHVGGDPDYIADRQLYFLFEKFLNVVCDDVEGVGRGGEEGARLFGEGEVRGEVCHIV